MLLLLLLVLPLLLVFAARALASLFLHVFLLGYFWCLVFNPRLLPIVSIHATSIGRCACTRLLRWRWHRLRYGMLCHQKWETTSSSSSSIMKWCLCVCAFAPHVYFVYISFKYTNIQKYARVHFNPATKQWTISMEWTMSDQRTWKTVMRKSEMN